MEYKIRITTAFKKDLKKMRLQNFNLVELEKVINTLATGKKLDAKYRNHILSGDYDNCYECHIKPDWLLIYKIQENELLLILIRTGSHSNLFK